jgi:predicted amidohydrolase YtcJ
VSIGAFLLAHDIVAPHEWRMPHKTYPAVRGQEQYLEAVKKIIDEKTDTGETALIWGYHKSWHGVLTLADLDKATGDVPTVIYQRSTHEIYLNSAAMTKYDIKNSDDYLKRIEELPKYNTDQITFLPMQYKTFADGAIYSLALQLQDGFTNCPNCHAEWIIPPEEGEKLFNYYWDHGYKIHIHITGDLAFEKYLDITERAMERNPRENHRTTFHHIGLFTAEQAQRAADLGVEASANPY